MLVQSDYLIVGSGVAGLYFAIQAARSGATVAIVTKKGAADSNTRYAQGGIAAVFGDDDSAESHIRDTLDAGAGLCHRQVVETAVREGPGRVADLLAMGARFSRTEDGQLSLGREGGHSRSRVVHADDWTGRELSRALLEAAQEAGRVSFYEEFLALDLIVDRDGCCRGVWAGRSDGRRSAGQEAGCDGALAVFAAPVTLLATGGAGRVYASTTNPPVATGDGIAMAYRAGAAVANLEFFQFHPTALAHPAGQGFLISEALRGYGAVLVNDEGEAFVERQLKGGSLATRDVVARAIVAELKRSGRDSVFLDATRKDPAETHRRFPNISRFCGELGIDIARQPIPVAPAAHYLCGGVRTDIDGRTDIPGLYAAGEVAHTGLHGANRLASNSLLEALVFAGRALERARASGGGSGGEAPLPAPPEVGPAVDPEYAAAAGEQLGRLMLEDVGIVRSDAGLERACERLDGLADEVAARATGAEADSAELRNKVLLARLVAHAARRRKESRGVHYNQDHPERDDEHWQHDTLLRACRRGDGRGQPLADNGAIRT